MASELQAIKDRFWPERSEWAKLSGLILFDSDYHKYRKQLFAALTDMQDSIEKTSAGDNFDNSISALDRSSKI